MVCQVPLLRNSSMPVSRRERKTPDKSDTLSNPSDSPQKRFRDFVALTAPVPEEWITDVSVRSQGISKECTSFEAVLNAWKGCMRWREDLEQALTAMLAVCLSTEQLGNQLFLKLIGSAGSGKTELCNGLLASENCYRLERLTGFFSGWQRSQGEDYSPIGRMDRKTLVTPEADTMASSPNFGEMMSQMRGLYDGSGTSTYKTEKEDTVYKGLRVPWIIVGTPELMNIDQSRLGDRFVTMHLGKPTESEIREIQSIVANNAIDNVLIKACDKEKNVSDEKWTECYALTGGYVDYLRKNCESVLSAINIDRKKIETTCNDLGELAADFRSRPSWKKDSEADEFKELPTRLTHQFTRFLLCVAGVRQETQISKTTIDIVKKLAIDTGHGRSFEIARILFENQSTGVEMKFIQNRMNISSTATGKLVRFMKSPNIDIVKMREERSRGKSKPTNRYRLTDRSYNLMRRVMR